MKSYKGSITIFMAFSLTFLLSIITSIIEISIINTSKAESEINAYNAQRSVAGYYHVELWDRYDILALDFSKDRQTLFKDYMTVSNRSEVIGGNGLMDIDYSNASLLPKMLVEDGGREFVRQAAISMKYRIPANIMNTIKGGDIKAKEAEVTKEASSIQDSDIIDKWDDKYNKKAEKIKDPRGVTEILKSDDSFFDTVKDNRKISSKSLENKVKIKGTLPKIDIKEEALFNEYILSHFKSALTTEDGKSAIDYEVEYIISGKLSDNKNLNSVSNKIKLIRYPFNFAYLVKDATHNTKAQATALLLAGWTLNPGIVKAVKYAIIAGWTYAETAIDVKGLLQGKKVPLIKDKNSWNLGYTKIFNFRNVEPKNNKNGLVYDDYLRMLLILQNNRDKTKRSLEVINAELNSEGKPFNVNSMAYAFDSYVEIEIGKKFFSPMYLSNNLYKHKFIAGYRYR